MLEQIGVVVALIGGAAAAIGTVLTSLKSVQEGNFRTLQRRLAAVEQTQNRQNVLIIYLTNWQFDARRMFRLMNNLLADNNLEYTPQMRLIQARLDKHFDLDAIMEETDVT